MGLFWVITNYTANYIWSSRCCFWALTISKGKKVHGIVIIIAAIVFALIGFTLGYIIASQAGL